MNYRFLHEHFKDLFIMFICHRLPERTFKIKEYYFPVCSRCTGLYIGVFSCFMYIIFFYVDYTFNFVLISLLLIIPTFIDGITQFFGLHESNNILRFSTGLIAGMGLVILINSIRWIIIMN
jgi:uncharacterized membrane protein